MSERRPPQTAVICGLTATAPLRAADGALRYEIFLSKVFTIRLRYGIMYIMIRKKEMDIR